MNDAYEVIYKVGTSDEIREVVLSPYEHAVEERLEKKCKHGYKRYILGSYIISITKIPYEQVRLSDLSLEELLETLKDFKDLGLL
ncbi:MULTISPECIES: hypothetical protein [unclassified Exiguobacterium]|uniref:hypothetical protein n=1 Tax=unclassified Exiguobacterium TaxID=2644629 RepID=UPI001BECB8B7|nr:MULTISPECIES: hypothetical protein [unclassified Exiguobacterium]